MRQFNLYAVLLVEILVLKFITTVLVVDEYFGSAKLHMKDN